MNLAFDTIAGGATLLAADTGGGDYVAAAYAVFVALLLVYVGIMSRKLTRLRRELGELAKHVGERESE